MKRTPERHPTIARLVIVGPPPETTARARKVLDRALASPTWKLQSEQVPYFITPGGFLRRHVDVDWKGGCSWQTSGDLAPLYDAAEDVVAPLLTEDMRRQIATRARRITIGVDLDFDAGAAQLVLVYDPKKQRPIHRTGKSFPTGMEERYLVQEHDVATHFFRDGSRRVAVLGCHDLNVFSPRSMKLSKGARRARAAAYRAAVIDASPSIVLHHPHITDSTRTWSLPWARLRRDLKNTGLVWASAIAHAQKVDDTLGTGRDAVEDVLRCTASTTGVFDVVVRVPFRST